MNKFHLKSLFILFIFPLYSNEIHNLNRINSIQIRKNGFLENSIKEYPLPCFILILEDPSVEGRSQRPEGGLHLFQSRDWWIVLLIECEKEYRCTLRGDFVVDLQVRRMGKAQSDEVVSMELPTPASWKNLGIFFYFCYFSQFFYIL